MNIKFTSSLTSDDENAIAPALVVAVSKILDLLPIAYMIRIDTSDSQVYQYAGMTRVEQDNAPLPQSSLTTPVPKAPEGTDPANTR